MCCGWLGVVCVTVIFMVSRGSGGSSSKINIINVVHRVAVHLHRLALRRSLTVHNSRRDLGYNRRRAAKHILLVILLPVETEIDDAAGHVHEVQLPEAAHGLEAVGGDPAHRQHLSISAAHLLALRHHRRAVVVQLARQHPAAQVLRKPEAVGPSSSVRTPPRLTERMEERVR